MCRVEFSCYIDVDPNSIGRRTNKLGLLDLLVTLEETKDLSSLEEANRLFNRSLHERAEGIKYIKHVLIKSDETITFLQSTLTENNIEAPRK
jgi:hypothetical protein